jgi:hypothetical protein
MRASEFIHQKLIETDREKEIREALLTLLTTMHATNIPSVSVSQLRKSLETAGYYVPLSWILDEVKEIPIVTDVDRGQVNLDIPLSDTEADSASQPSQEQNDSKVEQMARKALARRKN